MACNLEGEEINYDLNGFFNRAVQHEYDHLDGVLFIDRLSQRFVVGQAGTIGPRVGVPGGSGPGYCPVRSADRRSVSGAEQLRT